jgi:hypothetical protein
VALPSSSGLRFGLVLLVVLAVGSLSACESTQEKSRKLEARGGSLAAEKGVSVAKSAKGVKVISTDALQDENGTAAVVRLRNVGKETLANLPITIDVRGAGRKSLFRNDQPGLEPTLAHVPILRPGESFTWVNDQVAASGKPRSVKARVGEGSTVKEADLPKLALSGAKLESDPVSGVAAVGYVANRSKVEQRKLVIFAVARRGGRVVAAGRAQVPKLKVGKRAKFQAFFIGNPKGARLEVSAPPSTIR